MSEVPGGTPSTAGEPAGPSTSLQCDDEVPDPDEDDLDDLDVLLDAFSTSIPKAQEPADPAYEPSQQGTTANNERLSATDEDFSKQLQAQMAALIDNGDESSEMQKEIEAVLHELGSTIDPTSMSQRQKGGKSHEILPTTTEESFQDAILQTMQRMHISGEKANAAVTSDGASDDTLANMLKEMQSDASKGSAGEEEFSQMLMTMMENLTNKDILYDPMKELNDKFPSWMLTNKAGVKKEDLIRFEKQQRLAAEIVEKFEDSTYSDTNATDRHYIVERMHEVTYRNERIPT
ncbi:MAG: hypothetical protein Q9218_001529 [Villophora microphyllina]